MLCRNCGESIVDTARFCPYCGVQQRVAPLSQPASNDTSAHPLTPDDDALEASEVTVILPRHRASMLVAAAAQRSEASSASSASKDAFGNPVTARPSARALKIGGAAAILIVAVAAVFYASRVSTPAVKPAPLPATVTQPTLAPLPSTRQTAEPAPVSANPEASTPASEAPTAVKEAPIAATSSAAEPAPQPVTNATTTPPKEAAQRKKARAPAPPPSPAPIETPPPQPVEAVAPVPAPAPAPAPAPPPKVETVACAESTNLFSREACLWQECAKPEFRSHAECARFTGPR